MTSDAVQSQPSYCRRLLRPLTTAALLLLALVGPTHANPAIPPGEGQSCGTRSAGDPRPRIGLALGGGGARGVAHLGVLRKLEALHIPVDCIAGTSMGSLVGGMYASGMSVDDMEKLILTTDWDRLFDDSLERPERSFRRKQDDRDSLVTLGVGVRSNGVKLSPGLLQGERILAMFEQATLRASAIKHFDDLRIPYRAVATDLNTGEAVVLDHGSLAMAMRASMSLPGIFQPAEIDGRVLLDGGLVNQVPVDVVRAMGADIVIAVDVGTPLMALGGDASLLQVMSQITGMMTTGNTRRQMDQLRDADILILPELGDAVATGDFDKAPEALAIGRAAAEAAHDRLVHLSLAPGKYESAVAARPAMPTEAPVVAFVRLDNQTPYADEMLLSYVDIPIGEPLDTEAVQKGVIRGYSLGTLSSLTYEVTQEDGRTGVLLRARSKAHGPNYLQAGLTMNTDFDGTFEGNLRAAVLFSPLSPYGAEARVAAAIGSEPGLAAQYYLPLDVGNRYLLFGQAKYDNPNIHVYDADGDNIATYDVRVSSLEFKAGREFGNYGVLAVGWRRLTGSAEVEVGSRLLQPFDFDQGDLFTELVLDRLDSLYFPREGYYLGVGYRTSREWLGSDSEFDQVDFDAVGARRFGLHSVQFGARYHETTSGIVPLQSRYRLGGRGRLAGYRLNELTGQHYAVLFGGYSYQLAQLFGRSALVGATLEYGNAWERREDIGEDAGLNGSVYVGFDSWLGPMLFGFGWREGGEGVILMEIGQPF